MIDHQAQALATTIQTESMQTVRSRASGDSTYTLESPNKQRRKAEAERKEKKQENSESEINFDKYSQSSDSSD